MAEVVGGAITWEFLGLFLFPWWNQKQDGSEEEGGGAASLGERGRCEVVS